MRSCHIIRINEISDINISIKIAKKEGIRCLTHPNQENVANAQNLITDAQTVNVSNKIDSA